jgi:Icc-related predicted phosphoesterase
MRLVIISDTHSNLINDLIPDGDVLIHAGDLSISGSVPELSRVGQELGKLQHPYKLVIPGNHDFLFEHSPQLARTLMGADVTVLIDEAIEINGVKFYGSPWQPEFFNWAFNLPRLGHELEEVWKMIPDDTNVLITHGPAKERLDFVPRGQFVGCEVLKARIDQLDNLKLHCFGHIHYGYGWEYYRNKLYVNAALCDDKNCIVNKPIVVDIDEVTKETKVIQYE